MLMLQSVTFASLSHLYLKTWNCSFLQNYLPCVGLWSGVVPNSDPRQITDPLVLLGLGLGVGEELGNQVAISTRGGNNLAGDENGHNTGTAPARMDLMYLRWMCSCESLYRCGYLLYFTITDSSLRLGIYEFSPYIDIWTSNKSATLVLTNWGKKHYNKSRYQWWFNLKII